MCSGSEAGSYLGRMDFVYHSTLGLRVKKKKRRRVLIAKLVEDLTGGARAPDHARCLSLSLSHTHTLSLAHTHTHTC